MGDRGRVDWEDWFPQSFGHKWKPVAEVGGCRRAAGSIIRSLMAKAANKADGDFPH
jgi:hypothetical protein